MIAIFIFAAILVAANAQAQESPALKELRVGNLQLSAKSYVELAKEKTGNFLVCPLSVSVILALVEAGAGGDTAKQLISGLSLPDNEDKIHEAIKAITPGLNVDGDYTLTSANKVYVKEGFKIRQHFKQVATDIFKSEIQEIDFKKNVVAAEQINKWVLEKTHNKIKDLVSSDDLDSDTRAVLINALYFHGLWSKPFYVEGTAEKAFHVSSKKESKVKMMQQTDKFNYYEDPELKAKFLEMDYYLSPISMTFILPNDKDGLAALEANIGKVLETPKYSYEKVHVQIPHVNIEHKIDFIPILRKFGIKDAFERTANFSGINENEEKLVISKIIQKTFIAVEEKGTTAAAATQVIMGVGQSFQIGPVAPPKEFEANHPFIFVVNSPSGVLFVGRYITPDKLF